MPVVFEMKAFTGAESTTVNVSSGSATVSGQTEMITFLVEVPGSKVTTPDWFWKSTPAEQVAPPVAVPLDVV